jgi:hypothetical protein
MADKFDDDWRAISYMMACEHAEKIGNLKSVEV